jgi:hypothetical protein
MNNSKAPVNICEGSGSWLESIEFDGKVYWKVLEDCPKWIPLSCDEVPIETREILLESDSIMRKDH